ncbi:MAG TPA: glycoside hydrolase family 43 protein [Mycobacteriales bacterium]|nr:glycoside hydrolase family 43 protein [Mycobacteriales bacterium]
MRISRLVAVFGVALTAFAVTAPGNAEAERSTPVPIYAPAGAAADPGVTTVGDRAYAFLTGTLAPIASGSTDGTGWAADGHALSRLGAWSAGGAVWAPDAVRTGAGWVLYYAAPAKDMGGQRCIGTAVATSVTGPYEPSDSPLICPQNGGEDPVAGRPVAAAGVIDPSPFQDSDGSRYLLYKTQQSPATIRMFPLSADGLHGRGELSQELVRHSDSIENPVMVRHHGRYYLFASANWYDQCRYSTVWRSSSDLWSFADQAEHTLLDQSGTGLCGPGGADIVPAAHRIVFHAWVCSADNTPCDGTGVVTDPNKRRVLYGGILEWRSGIPVVVAFLAPA